MDQRASQLVTEHLGFAPVKFVDDVINHINEIMYRCMSDLELVISGQLGHTDEAEKGMAAIESLFENAVDKRMDRFEVFSLKNVFFIPNDVFPILPQYRGLDLMVRQEDEPALDDAIVQLKEQIETELFFQKECMRKQQELQMRIEELQNHQTQLESLADRAKSQNIFPISEKIPSLYQDLETYHKKVESVVSQVSEADLLERVMELESSRLHLNAQILNHLSKVKESEEGAESSATDGCERSAWDITGEYRNVMQTGSLNDVSQVCEAFTL